MQFEDSWWAFPFFPLPTDLQLCRGHVGFFSLDSTGGARRGCARLANLPAVHSLSFHAVDDRFDTGTRACSWNPRLSQPRRAFGESNGTYRENEDFMACYSCGQTFRLSGRVRGKPPGPTVGARRLAQPLDIGESNIGTVHVR